MGKAHGSCLPRMRGAGVRDRPSGQPVRVVRIVSRNSSTRANRYVKTKSEIEKRNRRLVFPSLIKTVRPEPSREKPPKKGNEAAMPAKRRWLNPKNEGRDQFPSGWARYRQSRPDLAVIYSGEAWRACRAEQLREHPTCAVCGRKAVTADHVVNLAAGGDFDGPLQSLCMPHHREKTLRESHEGAKRAAARRKEK